MSRKLSMHRRLTRRVEQTLPRASMKPGPEPSRLPSRQLAGPRPASFCRASFEFVAARSLDTYWLSSKTTGHREGIRSGDFGGVCPGCIIFSGSLLWRIKPEATVWTCHWTSGQSCYGLGSVSHACCDNSQKKP